MCSFFFALFRPSSWDWLNDRSLNLPISLMSEARNVAFVACRAASPLDAALPTAAAVARATTSATGTSHRFILTYSSLLRRERQVMLTPALGPYKLGRMVARLVSDNSP